MFRNILDRLKEAGAYLMQSRLVTLIIIFCVSSSILIGYVSEVTVDSNNLTRSGYITPAVDFKNLQEVLVITTTKADLVGSNQSE